MLFFCFGKIWEGCVDCVLEAAPSAFDKRLALQRSARCLMNVRNSQAKFSKTEESSDADANRDVAVNLNGYSETEVLKDHNMLQLIP